MPKRCLIGIDLGSSSTKTSLFDSDGRACGDVTRGNHPHQPQSGVAEYSGPQMLAGAVWTRDAFKVLATCVTPYNVDKLFWLTGSGNFYLDGVRIGRNRDEFIDYARRRLDP